MSKWVRLNSDKTVREIIPEDVVSIGIAVCFGEDFAAECIEAPEDVGQNWIYDVTAGTFSPPVSMPFEPPTPTMEERNRADIDFIALIMGVDLG